MYILLLSVCVLFTVSIATEEGFKPSPYGNEKNCEIKQVEGNMIVEMKKSLLSSFRDNCQKYNLPKDVLYYTVVDMRKNYEDHHWFGTVNAEYMTVLVPYARIALLNKSMVVFGVKK